MLRTVALGLIIAGAMPITVASSTVINNYKQERTLGKKQLKLNEIATNLPCTTSNLRNNCLATSSTFDVDQFAINTDLWRGKSFKSIRPNPLVSSCSPRLFSKNNYIQDIISKKQNQINQLLNYSLPRIIIVLSSERDWSLSSPYPSASWNCSFTGQRQLNQKSFDSKKQIEAPQSISSQNLASNKLLQSQFPQLSRSSLIVTFPHENSRFAPQNTKLANPAPKTKRIASPFGWRRRPYSNQLQFHQGIDYGAPYGSPVVAVGNGIVTKVVSGCADFGNLFCGGQLGNWIEVDHGNGIIGTYGHLKSSSIKVTEGMKISKNQKIAQVGSSGWSTGAHLDFRLQINGKHENPAKYVMTIKENLK
ncbi:MAG: M23 family metallopeptidase [Cyanobacteria bacterium P01_G01_bin.39]